MRLIRRPYLELLLIAVVKLFVLEWLHKLQSPDKWSSTSRTCIQIMWERFSQPLNESSPNLGCNSSNANVTEAKQRKEYTTTDPG